MRNLKQLVIIERRPIVRDFMFTYFSGPKKNFGRVGAYNSLAEALAEEELPEHSPLLFLVGGGLFFIEQTVEDVRKHCPLASIIVMDNSARQSVLQMALDRQIEGYFSFHDTPTGVLEGIERVARGERFILIHGVPVDAEHFSMFYSSLSNRERQLLRLMVNGHDPYECSSRLNITVKSVENLKTRLMRKTSVHNTSDLILFGIGLGLKEN